MYITLRMKPGHELWRILLPLPTWNCMWSERLLRTELPGMTFVSCRIVVVYYSCGWWRYIYVGGLDTVKGGDYRNHMCAYDE